MDPHDLDGLAAAVRDPRRITPAIWDGRRYVQVDRGDLVTASSIPGLDRYLRTHQPKHAETVRAWLLQRPTLWMERHDLQGGSLYPQVRPAKSRELGWSIPDGFWMPPEKHVHAPMYEHRHLADREEFRDARGNVFSGRWGEALERHFGLRSEEAAQVVVLDPTHGGRARDWHEHPMDWTGHVYNPDKVDEHAVLGPGFWDAFKEIEHAHEVRLKYAYLPDSGERDPTLDVYRIDVHPFARPLLQRGGDVAWWAFEGVLKSDSMLSVGADRDGMPTRAVFDSGSVSLWRDPDRGRLYDWLRLFRLTVLVPDSDWSRPPEADQSVQRQVRKALQELSEEGIRAVAAAPLSACGELRCPGKRADGHDESCKRGVDDWIAEGGDLGEMIVQFDEAPEKIVANVRSNRTLQRVEDLLLAVCGPQGDAVFAYSWIGERLDIAPTTAEDSVKRLATLDRLEIVNVDHFHGPTRFGKPPTHVRAAPEVLARRFAHAETLRAYAARFDVML